jgi:hypothetical protein
MVWEVGTWDYWCCVELGTTICGQCKQLYGHSQELIDDIDGFFLLHPWPINRSVIQSQLTVTDKPRSRLTAKTYLARSAPNMATSHEIPASAHASIQDR